MDQTLSLGGHWSRRLGSRCRGRFIRVGRFVLNNKPLHRRFLFFLSSCSSSRERGKGLEVKKTALRKAQRAVSGE
jgi:hypothetical protein